MIKNTMSNGASKISILKWFAIFLIIILVIVNEFLISTIALAVGGKKTIWLAANEKINRLFPQKVSTNIIDIVMARGVPEIYGTELGVSFDNVQPSIDIMKKYDQSEYGNGEIKLSGDKMTRYIKIGKMIACEFCCNATTMVFDDGRAACACGHSIAMRGLLAYLIEKHGSEYSDDQMLRELARWKGIYFPAQMVKKVTNEVSSGKYSNDVTAILTGIDKDELKKTIKDAPANPADNGGASQPLPGQQGGC
jgi:hypothetical protein